MMFSHIARLFWFFPNQKRKTLTLQSSFDARVLNKALLGDSVFCNVAMLNDRDHATVIILTGIFDFDEYVEFWDVL